MDIDVFAEIGAWEQTTRLVRKILTSLPALKKITVENEKVDYLEKGVPIQVGEFEHNEKGYSFSFYFTHEEKTTCIEYYSNTTSSIIDSLKNLVLTEKGKTYVLSQNEIRMIDNTLTAYPRFEWRWSRGNTFGDSGNLKFLRIALDDNSFVKYESMKGDDLKAYKCGQSEILDQLPDSLIEQKNILDKEIPWNIEYFNDALEILEKSRLKEITDQIEKFVSENKK